MNDTTLKFAKCILLSIVLTLVFFWIVRPTQVDAQDTATFNVGVIVPLTGDLGDYEGDPRQAD